ncbi:MAG: efflux RND transporter periplasmic adaptor subunit [Phenylobacterium sp.]|nr:efflux RND transporter periplasmic adaptor subunit [Phenylobacterium sp.]
MSKSSLLSRGPTAALLATATALAACSNAVEPPPQPRPVIAVSVQPAGDDRGVVTGQVRSTGAHDLAAETGGRVVRIAADVGDRVRAGQVLVELDGEPAKLEARQAAAQAAAAQADLQRADDEAARQAKLAEADATSASALVAARTEATAARQRYVAAQAQANLANRTAARMVLRAPADGMVSARHVQLSNVVAQGAPVISIDAAGALEILAPAPSTLLAQMRPGETVAYRIGQIRGRARLEGVSSRSAGVDAQMARFKIVSGAATPGAIVELDLRSAGAMNSDVRVPLSAVVTERSGGRHVWVIEGGRLKPARVSVISVAASGARVRGDLKPGQSVVAAGAELLAAGDKVRPLPHAL